MQINRFLSTRNKLFLVLLLLVSMSPMQLEAANADNTTKSITNLITASDQERVNVTVEKKREKEDIEITSSFYVSLIIDLVTVLLIISVVYYPNYKKIGYDIHIHII